MVFTMCSTATPNAGHMYSGGWDALKQQDVGPHDTSAMMTVTSPKPVAYEQILTTQWHEKAPAVHKDLVFGCLRMWWRARLC